MADEHRAEIERNARRVAEHLARSEAEFGGEGVSEDSVAEATGLSHDDVASAVDYLENREDVVRFPHPLSTPPRTVLKPGRGWPDLRSQVAGGGAGGG